MSYASRLKALSGSWDNEKASSGPGKIPAGKYQYRVARAVLEESKSSWNKGHMQVTFEVVIVTGPMKGRKAWINTDLEQPAKDNFPSGIARFKGYLETLGVDIPKNLSEKNIRKVLEELVDVIFNGACVINAKGYANHYINDLVHAAPESDDDEDDDDDEEDDDVDTEDDEDSDEDDDEEDEEDEDDEDEDDEEDNPPPKKQAKPVKKTGKAIAFTPGKKTSKKPEPKKASKSDDDDDDDDWDDDFEDS